VRFSGSSADESELIRNKAFIQDMATSHIMTEKLALCVIAEATNAAVPGWNLACVRCTGASQNLAPLRVGSFPFPGLLLALPR
jgi:hypothetical protein